LSGLLATLGGISNAILFRLGESLPLPYLVHQPWRLVMAVFLHGSLIHVGFNMMTLLNIGPLVEELYGSARYLFIFIVTGIMGYVASSASGHVSVGASGSLLGLVGAIIAVTGGRQNAGAKMIRNQLLTWVVGIAIFGLLMPAIDNYAHAGGFAAGYLLGRIIPDRPPADHAERRRADVLGWLAAAVVAVSFIFMVMNYFATAQRFG
jgi:rhomboid protease GluP